jgi:hypothetical protein
MKKVIFLNTLLFLILFLPACKTYMPIDKIKPIVQKQQQSLAFEERQLERLRVGDSLQIERLEGDPLYLIFHSISNDSIKGVVWKNDGRKLQLPIDSGIPIYQVVAIKVRKFDAPRTLLVVGLGLVVFTVAVGLFFISVYGIAVL